MRTLQESFEQKEKLIGNFVSCPGDPPHAIQLVIRNILNSESFKEVVSQTNIVSNAFKNTRCKQFLKVAKQLGNNERLGVCNNFE